MLIPVKCFTCGNVLADKYKYWETEVKRRKASNDMTIDAVIYLEKDNIQKTPEAHVLDHLGLKKQCCRRHILTHVNIE